MTITPTIRAVPAYRLSVAWHLGAPEDISYTVYGPDAASFLAGQAPPSDGVFDASFDGTGVDARLLSTGAELVYDQPGYVTESGLSIAVTLQTSASIHRFTAQQITAGDAFTGALNSIVTTDTHTICNGVIPDQAGLQYVPGPLTDFTFVVDPAVASAVLDLDINEDNVLHATQVITDRMGAFVDPQRTQFVLDSGDMGMGGVPSVWVGGKGASPHVAFGTDAAPLLRASTAQAQTTDQCKSCSFKGGTGSHGMPASGKFTDLLMLLTNDMPILGLYASTGVGGVYIWPGDGVLYPISQAMGVNGLWYGYDFAHPLIYAATDAGVYTRSDNVVATETFARLGAMALKCYRVQREFTDVYTLAEFAGSNERHVLKSAPGATGGVGYDDWTQITSIHDLQDFAIAGDYLYCLLGNSPSSLWVHQLSTGDTDVLPLPSGVDAAIIGLDPISPAGIEANGIFVRTSLGSANLYYLDKTAGPVFQPVNTDNSLVDSDGNPVLVNSVRPVGANFLTCSTHTVTAWLFASTSLGVFYTVDSVGLTGWTRTDGQSSLGDFGASYAVAGSPNGYTDPLSHESHTFQVVCAIGDTSLYYSTNGSVNWVDALSQPLDAGPFFYQHFRQAGAWPTTTDTSIALTYNGHGYTLYRTLSGIGQFSYVLVNAAVPASVTQHRVWEGSEISSGALLSDAKASAVLVDAMARFLEYTRDPQILVEVESRMDVLDTGNSLRTLRPCMQVSVTGEPVEYLIAPGLVPFSLGTMAGTYYVLDHELHYDRDSDPSSLTTRTRLGSLLLTDRSDPAKITADLIYAVSRTILYQRGRR